MLNILSSTDIEYTKKFTKDYEYNETIRFYDNKITDMYSHNFTFIKNNVTKDRLIRIIPKEIENRRNENADFLRIEFDFPIDDVLIDELPLAPKMTKYDYLYIDTQKGDYLIGNKDCIVKKAASKEILKDGIEVDILANGPGMGTDFARRRVYRKSEIYEKPNSNLDLYVCYYNGIAVGNCELMIHNDIAKIEDFDILEDYQRKGFGTSILKHLLNEATKHNIKLAYLITGSEDTAKEMYKKCGFKKAGEKIELFFDLK